MYDIMNAADLAGSTMIYDTLSEVAADAATLPTDRWVVMETTQSKTFTIDPTVSTKPCSWSPTGAIPSPRLPVGYTWPQAARLKWMLNHLP